MLVIMLLIVVVFLISSISSMKSKNVFNDMPFECGISSNLSSRKPYSMPFFYYTLIFILFDVEVILIFPLSFFSFSISFMIFFLLIFCILMLSILYEWFNNSLKW